MASEKEVKGPSTYINEILAKNDVTTVLIEIMNTIHPEPHESVLSKEELSQAIITLSVNLSKNAPYYGPLDNFNRALRNIASLLSKKESVLSRKSFTKVWSCLKDALRSYIIRSQLEISRTCAGLNVEKILVHSYGALTRSCLRGLRDKNVDIFISGPQPKEFAKTLIGIGIKPKNIAIIPHYYSYQVTSTVDAFLFEAETISVERILTRPGVQLPLSVILHENKETRIYPISFSLAYIAMRGKGLINYQSIVKAPRELEWRETVYFPVFEIVHVGDYKDKIKVIDEYGVTSLKSTELRKRINQANKRIIELVEARCKLFD